MTKNKLTLKKAHVPIRICLKMGLKSMWKKKIRFLIVLILCSISLAFLSFAIELNGEKLRQNIFTMVNNGYQYTDIKLYQPLSEELEKENEYNKYNAVSLPNNSYQDIKSKIPELSVYRYEEVVINYAKENIENVGTFFYPGYINTIIMYDTTNDYNLIAGRNPNEDKKEIIITDYLAEALSYFNVIPNCKNIYDYLYKYLTLNNNEYQIVGIMRTNVDKWRIYANNNISSIDDSQKQNYSFINDFTIMNSVVLPKTYFELEAITNYQLFLNQASSLRTDWSIEQNDYLESGGSYSAVRLEISYNKQPLLNNSYYNYNFGTNVIADGEIVIPYTWLRSLYGLNDIDSYNTWYLYYVENFGKKVTGTSITLNLSNRNGTHTKEYTVVGISSNTLRAQISNNDYLEMYNSMNETNEKILVNIPQNPETAYNIFNKARDNGYIINVFAYQKDIDTYKVDPFINILSKAGLFVFTIFTMGIMWTIITLEIVDSKKEIGILRSIGLSGWKVSLIFVIQILLVNILAYGLAIYLASLAIPWYNSGITDELNVITLYMYTMTFRTPLYLAIFVIVITIVATFIPLYKIMSQKIIDVINERDETDTNKKHKKNTKKQNKTKLKIYDETDNLIDIDILDN